MTILFCTETNCIIKKGLIMQTMAISDFKAHALKVLDKISTSKESVIVTKRGKPLARVIPFQQMKKKNSPGKLIEAKIFEGDILSPIDEKWDADQ